MKKFLIAPSILSANFARLGYDINRVVQAGADLIHFDVMDNHYVSNLTIGPLVLKSLREYGINIPIDVHLMSNPIDNLIIQFAEAGANYITFHPENSNHINKSIELIKNKSCKVGLAFNISTPLNYLDYTIENIDMILIMSVNPGLAGQVFINNIYKKIKHARNLINKKNKKVILSVDGGIKIDNISKIASAGADLFIIGSAIFNHYNYKKIIKNFKKKLEKF